MTLHQSFILFLAFPLSAIFKEVLKVFISQLCLTLCDPMVTKPSSLLCLWNSPGKNTGVGSHSLLQGIFLIQGSKLSLLHHRGFLTI